MKSYEELLDYAKDIKDNSFVLDCRDLGRIATYLKKEDLVQLGVKEESLDDFTTKEYTRDNILKDLESDLEFAFTKALDKRGISSAFMFEVIRMWNTILEEGLQDWSDENYKWYGLPLYKATALKYGFDNPIGEDTGEEDEYGDDY